LGGGGGGFEVPQTTVECVPEEGSEEDTWTSERELMGDWRKLQNMGLHDLNSSSNIWGIKSISMGCVGYMACRWEKTNAYGILVAMPEG